eukprot:4989466-Pyramimonas_sp.AAC.1
MRVQQLRWFAVLRSQEWRSGTIQDRQGATVKLTRGVGRSREFLFGHASGSPKVSCNEAGPSVEMSRCRGL